MNIALETIGCRTNRADSSRLEALLAAHGHTLVKSLDEAELVVVNSCTVTARADRDSRAACYRARRAARSPLVLLFGCLVRSGEADLSWMDHRTFAVASFDQFLPELARLAGGPAPVSTRPELSGPRPGESRHYLKVQEGCDQACSYCIVPEARGRPRSVPLDQVLEEARAAVRAGFSDVVLTGTHAALWGRDLSPRSSFPALLDALAREGLPLRYRLGSLEPLEDDQEAVLEAMAPGGLLCPHLHSPLQSGCQAVLEAMGRPWGLSRFQRLTEQAARICGPLLTLGTDLIVGFPGEAEPQFRETLDFLEASPLVFIHAFSYSPRPGTPAARLPGAVTGPSLKGRMAQVQDLAARKLAAFQASMVGRTLAVSVEAGGPPVRGLSENFLRCTLEGPGERRPGTWVQAEVRGVNGTELRCRAQGPLELPLAPRREA